MRIFLHLLGTLVAVVLTVGLFSGIAITGSSTAEIWLTTFLVALVWSAITLVIRPVLALLTLPITIVTFGLFAFVLNALLFWAMELIVPGFMISGFWTAFWGAIVLSIINWIIQKAL